MANKQRPKAPRQPQQSITREELRAQPEPFEEPRQIDPEQLVIEHNGRPAKRYPAMWLKYLDGQLPSEEIILLDVHGDLPEQLEGQMFWHSRPLEQDA